MYFFILQKKLGDNGVLLFPSYPVVAPHHYQPYFTPLDFSYFGIFSVLQLPVTQVPIGLSRRGLPMGLQVGFSDFRFVQSYEINCDWFQVVAAPHQDRICFAVAEYIESLTSGWVPPFAS